MRSSPRFATEIAGSQAATSAPFFSPDGQWVGFRTTGKLRKARVDGGLAADLCDMPTSGFRGASWGNGWIAAALGNNSALVRIPSDGGTPSPLTTLDAAHHEVSHRWPQVLPGGEAVLFTVSHQAMGDQGDVEVVKLGDGKRKTVYSGAGFARYVPSGHLLLVRDETVYAVPFDLSRLEVRGNPVPLMTQVYYATTSGLSAIDFAGASPTGMALYSPATQGDNIIEWITPAGTKPLLPKPGNYTYPRFSPDGQRFAVIINRDLYELASVLMSFLRPSARVEWAKRYQPRIVSGPATQATSRSARGRR